MSLSEKVPLAILAFVIIGALFVYPAAIFAESPYFASALMGVALVNVISAVVSAITDPSPTGVAYRISTCAQWLYAGMLLGSISGCAATPSINPDALLDSVALEGGLLTNNGGPNGTKP